MNLEFDENALEDLRYWQSKDKKKFDKIVVLLEEVRRTPFMGKGKPEPLRYHLSGCWSRRIDRVHRLVYEVRVEAVRVLACRFHY